MRVLVVLLSLLVPTVTTAQAVAPAAIPMEADYDLLPIVADNEFPWLQIGAFVLVLGFIVFLGVAGEDLGIGCAEGSLIAVGVGAVAYCLANSSDEAPARSVTLRSGATYDVETALSFASGSLSADQRSQIATSAREAGQEGTVLQRLVHTPSGVGDRPGEIWLEVAIVEASTGQLRPFASGPLGPETVLRVPVEDSLEVSSSEALRQAGVEV